MDGKGELVPGPDSGPTRDDDSRIAFNAQVDQDIASIVEKIKACKGYQVTFSTVGTDGIMNYAIRNGFPDNIALKVHKECKEQLIKLLEG